MSLKDILQHNRLQPISLLFLIASATVWAAALLVEAESFQSTGGWVLDQQFIDQMGSPYLLAHGLGRPVADATTTDIFPAPGTYRMWVRTQNWVPGPWEAPGRFQVAINDQLVSTIFGTQTGWTWQDGGMVTIAAVSVRIDLRDLTGFDGRCDAIYFDSNPDMTPPNTLASQRNWRNQLRGLPATPQDGGRFDVVIVGGGVTGCAAALAADQQGLKTALIQDRPKLGGNASSEVRVHTLGIYGQGQRILEKIDTEHYPNGSPDSIQDEQKRYQALSEAKSVTLFMPYRAYTVQVKDNRIVSVDISDITSGQAKRIHSDIFIDCTGDGWIGYWAGADYRYGRENRDEFSEAWTEKGDLWSPAIPDKKVMGSSLLWYSSAGTQSSTFPEVPWAMDVAKSHAALAGEWQWEYSSNAWHQIDDGEAIRDHMLRAIYGSFANAKKNSVNALRYLDWVGYLLGKRESRRLMGDYIYTLSDMVNGTKFTDAVAEEIREVDVHYQRIETASTCDFLSEAIFRKVPRYYIPFRCLYSRNIENLMM
ncbi:MAG: FAD-dependent oxidoreductase, partial [Anaerohalosphaeraceae bacterium]